jgi:hypothetical protein
MEMNKLFSHYMFKVFLFISSIYLAKCKMIELDFSMEPKYDTSEFPMAEEFLAEELSTSINQQMQMKTTICLGTPAQCFSVLVDTGSYDLWIRNKNCSQCSQGNRLFDIEKSSSLKNLNQSHTIRYGTGYAGGDYVRDTLSIGKNFTAHNFSFLLVNKEQVNSGIDGILGVGFSYKLRHKNDLSFSMIEQLYLDNQIQHKVFSQKFINKTRGKMFIGQLPEEIEKDRQHYGSCKVSDNVHGMQNEKWICNLDGVYFNTTSGKKTFQVNSSVLFDTGTNVMLVTTSYFNFLEENYFKEAIKIGQCEKINKGVAFWKFRCKNTENMQPIYYVVSKWKLLMGVEDLFHLYEDGYYFLLRANQNLNEWIIGEPLLSKFHMVFDQSNNEIGFYSENYVQISNSGDIQNNRNSFGENEYFPTWAIVLILIGLILILVSVIFVVRYKTRFYIMKDKIDRHESFINKESNKF